MVFVNDDYKSGLVLKRICKVLGALVVITTSSASRHVTFHQTGRITGLLQNICAIEVLVWSLVLGVRRCISKAIRLLGDSFSGISMVKIITRRQEDIVVKVPRRETFSKPRQGSRVFLGLIVCYVVTVVNEIKAGFKVDF